MAKAKSLLSQDGAPSHDEDRSLLSHSHEDEEDDIIVHEGQTSIPSEPQTPRTPRTPNRVRFDLPPTSGSGQENGDARGDPPAYDEEVDGRTRDSIPLLTGIVAPALEFHTTTSSEDVHSWAEQERLRPKSGLRSAFMNMANSIIGAGIIGQPYALKQAGLLTGVTLLIALTVVVDWTIRLIVINSKLSGRDSFQGTVEYCFGRKGLIGIRVAQWAFAFGGMVAFGVIVGDSIPHVLRAVWPDLENVPVIGMLGDRRICTVVFVGGVSWPLSLYRDIAMVSEMCFHIDDIVLEYGRRDKGDTDYLIVGKSKHTGTDQYGCHTRYGSGSRCTGAGRR
jgi:sodium-coupled neutral amino acid transporter 11